MAEQTESAPAQQTKQPPKAHAGNGQILENNPELMELEEDLVRVPLRIKGKDGKAKEYAICELDGHERSAYLNDVLKNNMRYVSGKPAGMLDYSRGEIKLLEHSIRHATLDSQGNIVNVGARVDADTIKAWRSSIRAAAFNKAQKISALDDLTYEERVAEAKNS